MKLFQPEELGSVLFSIYNIVSLTAANVTVMVSSYNNLRTISLKMLANGPYHNIPYALVGKLIGHIILAMSMQWRATRTQCESEKNTTLSS